MNNNINECVKRVLEFAEQEMLDLNHPYVGSEHLLLSLLKCEKSKKILKKYDLTYDKFKNALIEIIGTSNIKSTYILYTPLLKLIIKKATQENDACDEITLLKELISGDDGIAIRIMMELNVDIDSLYAELSNVHSYLDEIGVNMMKMDITYPLIGREKEINSLLEILLRKNKNNPILIGEAGVGKTAIVYELAKRIKEGKVPESLKDKKIYMLDMASLLSNTKYRGEFETKINNLIKETIAKENIILFIDEIHTIVRTGGGEGSCDAANILKPYLASDKIKLIGATTSREYDTFISEDSALSRRFARIYISEPTEEETFNILLGVKKSYEEFYKIKIDDIKLKKITELATKYITNNQNPDKSLEVLDCLLSHVLLLKENNHDSFSFNEFLKNKDYKNALRIRANNDISIRDEDIISVIENLVNVKILNKNSFEKVSEYLDNHIKGQNLSKLKELLKKKCETNEIVGMEIKGPVSSGKTYTAKIIANALDYNLIELDMKEFRSSTSINRLIGSDPGYVGYESQTILDRVKYRPHSLILLKNIEFASPNVLELFNSIIDKGYLIDKNNNKINFNFTLIIKTNNETSSKIGYEEKETEEENVIKFKALKTSCLSNLNVSNDLHILEHSCL